MSISVPISMRRLLPLLSASALAVSLGATVATTTPAAASGTQHAASSGPSTPPSQGCTRALDAFDTQAVAGSFPKNAYTVSITPTAASLSNPATPSAATGVIQKVSVHLSVHGAPGTTFSISPATPVTLSIYAPASAITKTSPASKAAFPRVLTATSSTVSFTYAGSYLTGPITLEASARLSTQNPCTTTASFALGSTTMPLANTPSTYGSSTTSWAPPCSSGNQTTCAQTAVDTTGLATFAEVGYGTAPPGSSAAPAAPSTASQKSFTIDTGSTGTAVALSSLGPDALGPGGPAMKYYDSSGKEFTGYLYLAPVAINAGGTWLETAPIRVLAVIQGTCNPEFTGTCHPQTSPLYYLGVGFDRGSAETEGPFTSPADNALLQVLPGAGQTITPGYTLAGASLSAGLTAPSTTGYQTEPLTASLSTPGDFNTAAGCLNLPPYTATPVCGTILLDVGIDEMFITAKHGAFPVGSLLFKTSQPIQISFGTPSILSYSFLSGPVAGGKSPAPQGLNPSKVDASLSPSSSAPPVFINTGRHVLFGYSYLFDAAHGLIGLSPLAQPLRPAATS